MTRAVARPIALPAKRTGSTSTVSAKPAKRSPAKSWAKGYWRISETPLHSLAFIFPMLVLFEVGTALRPNNPIAFHMLKVFCDALGASAPWVPALALIVFLLTCHIVRHDSWKIDLSVLTGMAIESLILAMPLLFLAIAITRLNIHLPLGTTGIDWRDDLILSLGAGIYEELIFRLTLITILTFLFMDVLKIPKSRSIVLIVVISAISFSLYHYLGIERFQWRSFTFRTVAGVYFATLFVTRGFGITSGTHATYDVMIAILGHVYG